MDARCAVVSESSRVSCRKPGIPAHRWLPSDQHKHSCLASRRRLAKTAVVEDGVAGLSSSALQRHRANQQLHSALSALPLVAPLTTVLGSLASSGVLQLPSTTTCLLLSTTPLLVHGVGPVLDLMCGERPTMCHNAPASSASHATSYSSTTAMPLLYSAAYVVTMMAAYMAAASMWAQGQWAQLGLLVLSAGMAAVISMAAAHELGHRRAPLEQAAAQLVLCFNLLWPFFRGHAHHHKTVATPADHDTARLGESFWTYMPRSILGDYMFAWHEEEQEAARRHRPAWSVHNTMLWALAAQVGLLGMSCLVGGAGALVLHLGAAAIANLYVSALNYTTHYGLMRVQKANGAWSEVTQHNTFSSAFAIENALFFRVLTHWEHHVAASKPYNMLGFTAEDVSSTIAHSQGHVEGDHTRGQVAPRVPPAGVPMMWGAFLAFVPLLWRRVADPLAAEANAAHRQAVLAA